MANARLETRKERYLAKQKTALRLPISVATVNFDYDSNVGFLARALACFGGEAINIIGRVPEYRELNRYSGGMINFVDVKQHSHPFDFLKYVRENNYYLVSAELTDTSVNLHDFKFPNNCKIMIVSGHETLGVPVDILQASDAIVKIPILGTGACLNTSQTANIMLYEVFKQLT